MIPRFFYVRKRTMSIFVESPDLIALAENQALVIERFDSQSYITERLEAEGLFHDGGVTPFAFDGNALHEKAVASMLEVSEDFAFANQPEQRH